MSRLRARVVGLGTYSPERVLTNQDLERFLDTSDEWIVTRTGIRERHLAGDDETTATMAAAAARAALADAGLEPDAIDYVVLATNTPDNIFPAVAARVQDALGIPAAGGFDLQAGCTGLIYGLDVAAALIESGRIRRALVVGSDKLSSIVDYTDRKTAVLFGDGAGALVLEGQTGEYGLLGSFVRLDGKGADLISIPAGGSRLPASTRTVEERLHYIRMDGNETFRFAVRAMPQAVEQALERAGLPLSALDLLVPHQANSRIIEAAMRHFALEPEKVVMNIDRYGNTSVASIPLALADARAQGRLVPGRVVALAGFGAGLTWGANIIRWG
ncbi:beta-ketoacyl-acyl carrier protein synthase III 1 [Candidatus Hydrogenisulfobacillus filiaventi]|uniref:Beta-ketoacyl-[acyl-carrier-protein] synthase III n=1 Tax=Candidatus Hydrogenisulfobacillus filiaventi TaxID=2707344 RepID=A0A6F8ZGJ7_9FIRM|nr:ketoacyl-ACP synthase III [Bacillota bacterium]CAB1129115.1 beta-ketoacyl-acyl carrier protein synthase III 1 [Candidatus Hydrogenisulfobacillus filiaventi]